MRTVEVRLSYGPPWRKWFPIRSASLHEVQFGEGGVVAFEFKERRVMFKEGQTAVEIARLESDEEPDAICDFLGRIVGSDFVVSVGKERKLSLFGNSVLSIVSIRNGVTKELETSTFLGCELRFHGVLRLKYDALDAMAAAYDPDFEHLACVVSAVVLHRIAAASSAS